MCKPTSSVSHIIQRTESPITGSENTTPITFMLSVNKLAFSFFIELSLPQGSDFYILQVISDIDQKLVV